LVPLQLGCFKKQKNPEIPILLINLFKAKTAILRSIGHYCPLIFAIGLQVYEFEQAAGF
jgi:hypothetical protein